MKKLQSIKSKIIMFIFALILPLTATGLAYNVANVDTAKADSESTTNYYSGYMKEVSVTNNNFNSSTSTYSISTSLSGWSGQTKEGTAGIINVGNTFQTYMSGTYRLSTNPGAKATDKQILMINSKTSDSGSYPLARQGYKSSSISLSENSYYSFQVSYKSDTNYDSYTDYVKVSKLENEVIISADTFKNTKFDEYISFTLSSKTYYLHKALNESTLFGNEDKTLTSEEILYEDDEYIGFLNNDALVFVEKIAENVSDDQYTVKAQTQLYTTNFDYNKTSKNYTAAVDTDYYSAKTEYTSLNDYAFGSVYLKGLKDTDGKPVKAEYVRVTSKEWVTFYFFVATGSTSQSVSLDLWLGTDETDPSKSTGVVFYDDVHVYQYSENTFWEMYESYHGKSYSQTYQDENGLTTKTTECVNLVDLRDAKTLNDSSYNFDFENDEFQTNGIIKGWKKSGNGNAMIFNTKSPQAFKSTTGYDFVGSVLSCDVDLDEDLKPTITAHDHALGLWTKDNYVQVKSNDIYVKSNSIVKIKAYYKVSEITSGNVYMFVEENNNVLTAYNLTEDDYTLTTQTASTGTTSNGDSEFNNKYGVIEFYIKGGVQYDSSINVSLGLGKADETATGCVIFDNVSFENATSTEYENATNKVELDTYTDSSTPTNGNFNKVTIDDADSLLHAPADWTIDSESGKLTFAGVINTQDKQFANYTSNYTTNKNNGLSDRENPYVWADIYGNPSNSKDSTTSTDNVLMFANIDSSYQQLKSANLTLEADKVSKVKFNYKTTATGYINISVYGSDGFKIFEANNISSQNTWEEYEIYLNALSGENEIYVTIDFGTKDAPVTGAVYIDNFALVKDIESTVFEEKSKQAEGNLDKFGVVDLTDFYLNVPTNNITNEVDISKVPAYTGTLGSANDGVVIEGGIVKSEKFDTNSKFYIENAEEENVFFITSTGVGSYSIDSKYNLDLKSANYYVLTFTLKTNFAYTNDNISLDSDKTYSYGASVGLSGFDYATGLVSNDEYTTYTIHIKPSEDVSAKLHISLTCDTAETAGSVAVYGFKLESFTEDEGKDTYDLANDTVSADGYDVNNDKVFVAKTSEATEDDSADDSTDDNEGETTPSSGMNELDWSILIASIITGAAIIVAVVGWALSKVKLKKIERKKKESYDRNKSLNVEVIKQKARKQRDAELAKVKESADKFQAELDNLEKEHKQAVIKAREQDHGKVSKNTDKEFKQFAQKRTVIAEKLASLNKQIDTISSAEYLLNLERKVYAQEEMRNKQLIKSSKKANKEADKKDKKD